MPKEKVNTKQARKSLDGKARAVKVKLGRGASAGVTPKDDRYLSDVKFSSTAREKIKPGDVGIYISGKKGMAHYRDRIGYTIKDFSDQIGTGYRYYDKEGKFVRKVYTRIWDEEEDKKLQKRLNEVE